MIWLIVNKRRGSAVDFIWSFVTDRRPRSGFRDRDFFCDDDAHWTVPSPIQMWFLSKEGRLEKFFSQHMLTNFHLNLIFQLPQDLNSMIFERNHVDSSIPFPASTLKARSSKKETSTAKQSSTCGESERECFGFNVTDFSPGFVYSKIHWGISVMHSTSNAASHLLFWPVKKYKKEKCNSPPLILHTPPLPFMRVPPCALTIGNTQCIIVYHGTRCLIFFHKKHNLCTKGASAVWVQVCAVCEEREEPGRRKAEKWKEGKTQQCSGTQGSVDRGHSAMDTRFKFNCD